jgi:hypothetical protein
MKRLGQLLCGIAILVIAGTPPLSLSAQTATGRALFAYPIKGQTLEEQNADRAACHDWAPKFA